MSSRFSELILVFTIIGSALLSCDKDDPLPIPAEPPHYIAISAGNGFSMALGSDFSLWAWGYNQNGQLGTLSPTRQLTPVYVGNDFTQIETGFHLSSALKSNGSVWSWGTNTMLIPTLQGNNYVQLLDANHAIKSNGSVWNIIGASELPGRYIDYADGLGFSLAVRDDFTLVSIGDNVFGQLGTGDNNPQATFMSIGTNFKIVAAGPFHSLAIRQDNTLWAWGKNAFGEIGDGQSTLGRLSPVKIGDDFVSISAGGAHSAGIKSDHSLWTWGNNWYGQLGDGTNENRNVPTYIGDDFTMVDCGDYHTIAMKSDGSVWAWGNNIDGAIGDGSTQNSSVPKKIRPQ